MARFLKGLVLLFQAKLSMYLGVFILLLISCGQNEKVPELILDSRYPKIQHISTFANCLGPEGRYTTEVKSSSDGSCFFSQVDANSGKSFTAIINSDLMGFVIDSMQTVIDTLPNRAVEMIRSHDFHRLHFNPQHFFDSIVFDYHLDKDLSLYRAIDRLRNPISIYYNRNTRQISKVELLSPIDTTEVIEIINKKWTNSDYGKMVEEIEIIQAKKDTFYFKFERIEINK